jgi:hypothetical protein
LQDSGHPGLTDVRAVVYVDADAEPETLEELLADTVRRSPVTQTFLSSVSFSAEIRKA